MSISPPLSRRWLLSLVALLGLAVVAPAAAQPTNDEAEEFINTLISEAIEVLQMPVDQAEDREAGLMMLLDTRFDMPIITRLVLGRYWRRATPEQQQKFGDVFRTHIVRVYSSQLGQYEDQVIDVKQVTPLNEHDVVIFTEIVRGDEDPPLRLDWRVRDQGGDLRIVDVAAEGVSMLTTKRGEFTSVLAREGIDSLILRLEELNATGDAEES